MNFKRFHRVDPTKYGQMILVVLKTRSASDKTFGAIVPSNKRVLSDFLKNKLEQDFLGLRVRLPDNKYGVLHVDKDPPLSLSLAGRVLMIPPP